MNSSLYIEPYLIEKYNLDARHYTSYPIAPHFHTDFGECKFIEHAELSNIALLPKNLSIYVHVPFCHSLYHFDKVVRQVNGKEIDDYIERLCQEITMHGQRFKDERRVSEIHFGGGNIDFLSLDHISDVLNQIAIQFHLDLPKNLEIGIEIDPGAAPPDYIDSLISLGFNRFSIGVQGFSEGEHRSIDREKNQTTSITSIDTAIRGNGVVSVDMKTELPKQTFTGIESTLAKLIGTGVTRISAYNLSYLTNLNARLELVQLVQQRLLSAGYQHIGMGHYALPTDPLAIAQMSNALQLNFQGYTANKDTDIIGVGVGAISKFDTAFSQNESRLSLYNDHIDENILPIGKGLALSEDDRLCASVIQQIMCRSEVDLSRSIGHHIERNSNVTLAKYFSSELDQLAQFEADGLLCMNSEGFHITERGRYFIRSISAVFDRYVSS